MKKKLPIISVIIPIYNVAEYLEECLESVLKQTFRYIEVICINDGSTDNSGEIVDKYASLDNRIVVIHKQNTGYGNTMNVGLEKASGEYITILEPDDRIKQDMLLDLYTLAVKYGVDFVKSDYAVLWGKKGEYQISPVKIIENDQLYKRVLSKNEIFSLYDGRIAHWTSLYKRSFLIENRIFFHETPGASYQDTGFWFQTLFYAQRIYLTDAYYYCYRQDNPNSSVNSKEKVYCICKEYDYIYEKLKDNSVFMNECLSWYVKSRFAGYRDALERIADEYKMEFLMYMSEELKKWKQQGLLDLSRICENDKRQMLRILDNPKGYYYDWKESRDRLNAICENHNLLYIYGAGYIAGRVYKLLSETERKKIRGFIVTENKHNEMTIFGLPIYTYNELKLKEDRGILIGVSELYRQDIKMILEESGEKNIIELPFGCV